jgi:hypothetical protein
MVLPAEIGPTFQLIWQADLQCSNGDNRAGIILCAVRWYLRYSLSLRI